MTVKVLIEELLKLPPLLKVIIPSNSDYLEAGEVNKVGMVDRGGWFSHPARYRPKDLLLEEDVVLVG